MTGFPPCPSCLDLPADLGGLPALGRSSRVKPTWKSQGMGPGREWGRGWLPAHPRPGDRAPALGWYCQEVTPIPGHRGSAVPAVLPKRERKQKCT
ncbi:hypothetical protein AAFF_G00189570 [Aldrovandia affinis]|uniref:Uncharacterized protein n=1 Tax=Aldrovandia affinis TaxID=143900 RepID=A0AAD7RMB5_9TELE|nr:hypothetical protein AAFF_G00189570 [Aldrovandia affinis]